MHNRWTDRWTEKVTYRGGCPTQKLQKCEYLESEKSFSDEIKKTTFFIVFEGLFFGEKTKIW